MASSAGCTARHARDSRWSSPSIVRYQPGDDLRYVDWKIAARADRWVVKQYEEETNLRATHRPRRQPLDGLARRRRRGRSPSSRTPSGSPPRSRCSCCASATPSASCASTTRCASSVPPRARTGQWRASSPRSRSRRRPRVACAPTALEAGGAARSRGAGMVVLISDLLVDRADVVAARARAPRRRPRRDRAAHAWIPRSATCRQPAKRCSSIRRAVSRSPATVADVRAAYRKTVDESIAEWRRSLAALGAAYEVVIDRRAVRRAAAPRLRRAPERLPWASSLRSSCCRRRGRRAAAAPSHAAPHRACAWSFRRRAISLRAERSTVASSACRNLLLMMLRVLARAAASRSPRRDPSPRGSASATRRQRSPSSLDNSLSTSAVIGGRPLLDQLQGEWRAMSLGARPRPIGSGSSPRTAGARRQRRDAARELSAHRADRRRRRSSARARARRAARARRRPRRATESRVAHRRPGAPSGDDRRARRHAASASSCPAAAPPPNHAVTSPRRDPARWTPRGAVAARFLVADSATYRITLDGRTLARGTAARERGESSCARSRRSAGGSPARSSSSPTSCAADNVRHFAVWIGAAPAVASLAPSPAPFAQQRASTLFAERSRARRARHRDRAGRRAGDAARADHRADRSGASRRREPCARAARRAVALRRRAARDRRARARTAARRSKA